MILAIVGMTGSGKSEATSYLVEKGFSKIRFGQITMDILEERGLPVNEANERKVREELRKMHGMAAYAVKNIPKIRRLLEETKKIVLDGLYSWEEYLRLKEEFPQIKILCIYSSPKDRYARLEKREVRPLTSDEAFSRDRSEIENLHKAGPIAMADHTLINDGSIGDLRRRIDKIVGEIK